MTFELRDHPLFICGHPKSGTSLVAALLDSHPHLVVYPEESVFFRRYLPRSAGRTLEERLELAERYLIHIFTWNRENPPPSQEGYPDRDYTAIPYEAVCAAMRELVMGRGVRHPGDLLSAAVLGFGRVTGQWTEASRYWVEKTPYNERFADKIFEWWPQAKCIHVVRDPRDNYASYRRKHPSWSPEFFTWNWQRSLEDGLRNCERYGDSRYWLLRYEDMASAPESFVEQLCTFLAIDFHPVLLCPSRVGVPWKGNTMFDDRFQGISTSPIGRWRDSLVSRDVAVIEMLALSQMDKLSYLRSASYSFPVVLRVWRWKLRRWLSKVKAMVLKREVI